ncbi:MAG: flagellin [Halothiobacillaceae bacterium]
MASVVATNVQSLTAQRHLAKTNTGMQTAMERLSSGLRVNSAKDDSAGLAIAERMNAQVKGMNVAIRNANDGISLAQTAEGALQQVTDTLQRMRELATQSANATNTADDRNNLNAEYKELAAEVERIIGSTEFNGKPILAASAGTQTFQVGANNATNNQIEVTTTNLSTNTNITNVTVSADGGTISTQANARTAIDNLDTAIDTITTERADLGAAQNRFEATIGNLRNASENQAAARSRIMDADFAAETANLSKFQILQQAGTAMLTQANQAPQAVLGLLQ